MTEQPMDSGALRAAWSWPVVILAALSVPIALYGLAFTFVPSLNPDFHGRLMSMPWYGAAHFVGGGVALLIGAFQFSAWLRQRHRQVHRWIGRVYLGGVLVGGVGGFGIAAIAHGGGPTQAGFTLLAALWLYSAARAYGAIRGGDVDAHRRWMIRNFALTFGAVTLRIELGVLTNVLGWSFDEAYVTVAWLSWVGNLVVAEWWLLQRQSNVEAPA
jgi:uncharacterized membrane protein